MPVITPNNPSTVRTPNGYSHSIVVQGAERRVVISGQGGAPSPWPDGGTI